MEPTVQESQPFIDMGEPKAPGKPKAPKEPKAQKSVKHIGHAKYIFTPKKYIKFSHQSIIL